MTNGRVRGGFNHYGFTVGVLTLNTRFPRVVGDIGNAETFPFPVLYRRVPGADPDRVVRRGAEGLLEAFVESAKALEHEGVGAITTSCGFLVKFQAALSRAVRVPVLTSSLLLVPLVHRMLAPGARVGIITVNAGSLTPEHLAGAGIGPDVPVAVIGMETEKEFTRVLAETTRDARGMSTEVAVARDFDGVLALTRDARVVGVDMPIGLLDAAVPGGRDCDRHARRLLGRPRACSVFTPPARAALAGESYRVALSVNRASSAACLGISIECFGLFPRLREVDAALTADPALAERVREVHPELSFRELSGGATGLSEPKRSARGRSRRAALLRPRFARLARALGRRSAGVADDDVLDAHAVAWSAARIARDRAACLPGRPAPRDARGLSMAIWY